MLDTLFVGCQFRARCTSAYPRTRRSQFSSSRRPLACPCPFFLLILYFTWTLQIVPVPIEFLHPLCAIPSRLSITCTLGYVHTEIDTFAFSLSQVVQDASSDAHINVCALLVHPAWLPIPLLFPDAVGTLSGPVLSFQNLVFLILVDDITYLPRAPRNHSAVDTAENSWWDSID